MDARAEQYGHAPMALGAVLRRLFLRAPVFLPLLTVVGALLSSWFWSLSVLAVLLAVGLRLWRIGLACLLCGALAWLQQEYQQGTTADLQAQLATHDVVEVSGTVVRELRNGCIINADHSGARIVVRGDNATWRQGSRVLLKAEASTPRPALVHGMFDAARWMKQQGIAADLQLVKGEYQGMSPFSWASVCGVASAVRESLAQRIMPPGTEEDARRQVLCALVLGDKSRAEEETMLDFRRGGCLHAFAVSGLHVGLLAGILWFILRKCRVGVQVSRVIVLVVCGGYVVMTGFSVPAVRAFMMMALVLIGNMLHRRVSLLNIWSLVAMLILLMQPYQIYNAGFQLSFVVYAAICAGARLALRETPWFGPDDYIPYRIRTVGERRFSAFELAVRGTVIISLWAWLVSLPITMAQFHTLNAHSFITNILITPMLPLVMSSGLAAMILGSVPWLGPMLTQLALYSAQSLISLVALCGGLPAAYLPAQIPQPTERIALLSTGYGESACQLGNGGLLIASGNGQTARFNVEPAIFHSGFTPSALLLPRPLARRAEMAAVLTATWPQLLVLDADKLAGKTTLQTSAGSFCIYAPPADLPRKPMDNVAPIVAWQRAQSRVLYVGDASLLSFENLPESERRADVLILGMNQRMPVADAELILATGASTIILLPSASKLFPDTQVLAPAEVLRMPVRPSIHYLD